MKHYPDNKKSGVEQEQRTALINQVVTKGLDPNVEMKPSGVEWIGEIPAHWEINRLKHVAKILPSNVDKHIYPDEIQVRLCNYTDVYYNDYITVDTVENLLLPIPTDSEQQQIADFLSQKTEQIDELIAAEQRKIELLKEYRQSLISEAVTGKIDVRNEV